MSDSWGGPWSNNSYAPQMSYGWYLAEKTTFAGVLLGALFYGVIVALFFQCMVALLNPVNRAQGGIKWGLVAHTSAMFTFVTINTLMNLDFQSLSYVNNRGFPGIGNEIPPGPLTWRMVLEYSNVFNALPDILFFLNTWLADGLLLYRCYVIYSMNKWIIVLPCLVYLASLTTGIIFSYQILRRGADGENIPLGVDLGLPYFSISLSLNVLLTLMIVTRLAWHSRTVWRATRGSTAAGGLYKTLITMIIESFAMYTTIFVAFLVLWSDVGTNAGNLLAATLSAVQVISPFLIVLRVANRTAAGGNSLSPETSHSFKFRTRETSVTSGQTAAGDSYSIGSVGFRGKTFEEIGS